MIANNRFSCQSKDLFEGIETEKEEIRKVAIDRIGSLFYNRHVRGNKMISFGKLNRLSLLRTI